MAGYQAHRANPEPTNSWWVVTAWMSLGLVAVGGLAGAAGIG